MKKLCGMEFDPIGADASRREIVDAGYRLLGQTFGEISEEVYGMVDSERARSKAGVANVIEEGYFGIPRNSSPKPDFEAAGIELKVTPLKLTGDDTLVRPKERLVLSMVDYNEIAAADHWREVPSLAKKLEQMLVVWYIHIVGEDRADYPIVWVDLFEVDGGWDDRFQADFEILKEKVLNGEVPSERHTEYLGTCPKHGGGYKKEDPAASPRSSKVAPDAHPTLNHAEKRGWSIAVGGMLDFLQDSTGLGINSVGRSSGIAIEDLKARGRERVPEYRNRLQPGTPLTDYFEE